MVKGERNTPSSETPLRLASLKSASMMREFCSDAPSRMADSEISSFQTRLIQIGLGQISVGQVGSVGIAPGESGVSKIGPTKVGLGKVCSLPGVLPSNWWASLRNPPAFPRLDIVQEHHYSLNLTGKIPGPSLSPSVGRMRFSGCQPLSHTRLSCIPLMSMRDKSSPRRSMCSPVPPFSSINLARS